MRAAVPADVRQAAAVTPAARRARRRPGHGRRTRRPNESPPRDCVGRSRRRPRREVQAPKPRPRRPARRGGRRSETAAPARARPWFGKPPVMRSNSARLTSTREIPRFPASRTDSVTRSSASMPMATYSAVTGTLARNASATALRPTTQLRRVRSSSPGATPPASLISRSGLGRRPPGRRVPGAVLCAWGRPLSPQPSPRLATRPDRGALLRLADRTLPARVAGHVSAPSKSSAGRRGCPRRPHQRRRVDPGCHPQPRSPAGTARPPGPAVRAAPSASTVASRSVDSVRCQSSGLMPSTDGHREHRAETISDRGQIPGSKRDIAIPHSRVDQRRAPAARPGHRPWRPRTPAATGGLRIRAHLLHARSTKFSIRE